MHDFKLDVRPCLIKTVAQGLLAVTTQELYEAEKKEMKKQLDAATLQVSVPCRVRLGCVLPVY